MHTVAEQAVQDGKQYRMALVCPSVLPSVGLSVCLPACLPACLSVRLSRSLARSHHHVPEELMQQPGVVRDVSYDRAHRGTASVAV